MVLLCRSRLPYSPIFRLIAVAFLLEPLSAFVSNAAALLGIDYMYFVKSALREMPPTHAILISILDCTSNTSQPVQSNGLKEKKDACLVPVRWLEFHQFAHVSPDTPGAEPPRASQPPALSTCDFS